MSVRQVSLGSLLCLVGCGVVGTTQLPAPKPAKKTLAAEAHGVKHAVATENGEASRIAMNVLKSGGDAVDAAIAAALALGVTTPTACGLGGGGFALVYRAKTKEAFVVDFRETAPAKLDVAALDRRPLPPSERGHLVGVPGEVAGLELLSKKFGKKTFREDVLPAAELAKNGFTFTAHVAHGTKTNENELRTLAPSLGVRLLAGSGPLPVGTKIVRPDLAATLQLLAEKGARVFYEGSLADAMVTAVAGVGGTLTKEDLAAYTPKLRKPIRFRVGNREVLTMPQPSAGGVMMAEVLRAHEVLAAKDGKGFTADDFGTGSTMHTIAELMRGALDDRARLLGDPEATPVDPTSLFADDRMRARLAMIDPWSSKKPVELRIDEHGTSHLSIVDAEGNAVALTTTVNTGFGAKLVAGETGIVMNDQMDDFGKTLDSIGGPIDKKPNVPRAGARPTSSMTPTIVLEDGLPVAVMGGSGGLRIATSVTYVAVAHLVFGLSPGDAVGFPRMHPSWSKLSIEPSVPPSVAAELVRRGETVEVGEAVNAVQLVVVSRKGGTSFSAAADPRKGGVALAE